VEILTRAGFKNSIEQVHMKVSLENA
jgi:hypothetical protein